MKALILLPQFIDRAGRVVFHVHADDPDCRVLNAGHMLGQVRFGTDGFAEYEQIEQTDLPLDPKGVEGNGSG